MNSSHNVVQTNKSIIYLKHDVVLHWRLEEKSNSIAFTQAIEIPLNKYFGVNSKKEKY